MEVYKNLVKLLSMENSYFFIQSDKYTLLSKDFMTLMSEVDT